MKTPSFPYPVERGSVTVMIYRTESKGYTSYIVQCQHRGASYRKSFSEFKEAKEDAWSKAGEIDTGDGAALSMSSEDRASFLRARQLLAPSGISLEVAVAQFVEAQKLAGSLPIIDAVKRGVNASKDVKPGVTVAAVADELLKDRAANGVGEHHLRVLEGSLSRIVEGFPNMLVASMDGPVVKRFLDSLTFKGQSVMPRTRNNYRAIFGQLFNFAKFNRYLPGDFEGIDRIGEYKETPGKVGIYTPGEIAMLLSNAPATLLPFLAIGAFAGLRHAEIVRLDWREVNFATGQITVEAEKAKTASRRTVPISANLAQWLAPHAAVSSRVCYRDNMAEPVSRYVESKTIASTGFEWKHNALRHSFISYRLAGLKDDAAVALEAGNSRAMIHRHYKELVTPEQARAWFAVAPQNASKVVPMAA
jgi:integrase